MAILTILGKPPGRAGGTLDDHLDGDFVDEYLIRTDDPLVRREDVLLCAGLPQMWDRYSNVGGTFWFYYVVKSLDAKQSADSPFLWTVSVVYSTRISEERRQEMDPRDRPPVYKKRSQRATRAREYDDDGLPLVNSAALPFDPSYESEDSNSLLTIMRYEADFDDARDEDYTDSVNSTVWRNGLPGTWKCLSIDCDEAFERNTYCVQTVYSFLYKRSGWTGYHSKDLLGNDTVILPSKTRILDRGKVERLNGKIQWIYDTRAHPIPDPICLDGRGLRLDSGPMRHTKLTANILAATTTVPVYDPYAIVQGQRATIYQEDVIVDRVNLAAKTLTLVRGQNATVAEDHPSGSVLYQKSGASTTLANTILAGATDLIVDDRLVFGFISRIPGGGGALTFPAYGITPFIRIDREEMRVVNVGLALFTVIRGANGTAPAEHLAGAEVRQAPTFIDFSLLKYKNFHDLHLTPP